MSTRNLILSAGALVLGLASLQAQGPLYDKVMVNMPYTVTVGDKTLQPGDYIIRELPSAAKSHVLLIYSDQGMKFETSVMTIPALDNRTPEDTKVVLHHFGPDYYFDKVWIQGKNYGYEFPLPDSVKARMKERMEPINVAARYESAPAETTTTTTENTQTQTRTETAVAPQPEPAQPEATQTAPAQTEVAQAAPAPAPTTDQNATDQNAYRNDQSNLNQGAADRAMPSTAANWLMMLLSGGALSGAGLALRRGKR